MLKVFAVRRSRRHDRMFALERLKSVIGGLFFRARDRFPDRLRRIRARLAFVRLSRARRQFGDRRRRRQRRQRQKFALAAVEPLRFALRAFLLLKRFLVESRLLSRLLRRRFVWRQGRIPAAWSEGNRAFLTRVKAVEANDATRRVDRLVLYVNARTLARFRAKSATDAFVRVDSRLEK